MKNKKDLFIIFFLIVSLVGILIVRYCYDQAIINRITAIILNGVLGIPSTVVIIYYLIIYIKKRKSNFIHMN